MPLPSITLSHPTLIPRPVHHPGWVYEEKYDGWRIVAYKDGTAVRLVSRAGRNQTGRFAEVAGARGQLLAEHVHGVVHLVRGPQRTMLSVPSPVPTVREALGAFVRALREGAQFPISIEDGLQAVAIVDAAHGSAERGREGTPVAGPFCAT